VSFWSVLFGLSQASFKVTLSQLSLREFTPERFTRIHSSHFVLSSQFVVSVALLADVVLLLELSRNLMLDIVNFAITKEGIQRRSRA